MNKFIKPILELEPAEIEILRSSDLYKNARNSWKYSEGSEAYYAEYFSDYQNHSFVCFENNAPVALAFIYVGEKVGYFDQPMEFFLEGSLVNKKTVSEMTAYLLELAGGKPISMFADCQIVYELLKDNSLNISYETELCYAVDLSFDLDEIKRRFRKSYKSLVNWGIREVEYKIVDQAKFEPDEFYKLKRFHLETAGKQTRSDESWEIQKKMIETGDAYLINGYLDGKLVSSNLFMNGETSYYGVGVYDRNMMAEMNKGLAHGSMFRAMQYLKETDTRRLILAQWKSQLAMSEKEIQILDFKRGFTDRLSTRTIVQIEN